VIDVKRRRRSLSLALAALFILPSTMVESVDARAAGDELAHYVSSPDESYTWHVVRSTRIGRSQLHELVLQSQTWRGVTWKHQLIIMLPDNVSPSTRHAFFFIHGGRWSADYENGTKPIPRKARLFVRLAERMRAPFIVMRHVPFQPLFDRREDALIAYTFDQYLKTGEADWPLLLPMVKSAARGMDAVQEFSRDRLNMQIDRFTVAGASKRGWTSWLTAAIDPRVASVAPMVIDMLNMPAQIELQRATFGELSEEVQDYAKIDLPGRIGTDLGKRLIEIVDPYNYRIQLTQPKLILLGTNDRYWPLDALKLYWADLPEPKRVLYLPNQGHGGVDVKRLVGSLSALHRYSARGEALPQLTWSFAPNGRHGVLSVEADRRPRRVTAWTTVSSTRDFRDSRWRSHQCRRSAGDRYVCHARSPATPGQYTAFYAEVAFRDRGEPDFSLSTSICIIPAEDGKPGC
jgi:PhoPQ-activated pathogenicity-related protein